MKGADRVRGEDLADSTGLWRPAELAVGDCVIAAFVGRRMGKFSDSPFVCLLDAVVSDVLAGLRGASAGPLTSSAD